MKINMNNTDKTKEKLIEESEELQIENERLKELFEESVLKIKNFEELLIKQSERFAILNKYSIELTDQTDENISSFIVNEFKSFFQVKEVWLSIYDEKNSELVLKATTLSEKDNSKVVQKFGKSIIGKRIHVTADIYKTMVELGIRDPSSLHEISFGQIPVIFSSGVEKIFGMGWFQAVALTDRGKLYGGLLIAGHKGQDKIQKDELLTFRRITSNILRRKQAEKEFVASEIRYRQLSDFLPQLVFEADIHGNVTFVNQSGLKLLGYTQEEIQSGFNILNAIAPDDREMVLKRLQEILNGSETAPTEYHIIRKDGEIFPIFLHAALFTEDGKPKGIRGTGVDITELRKAEERLSVERNLLWTLIDNIPDRIYAKDINSRFIICNNALVLRMDKENQDEIIGKTDFDFLPNELASKYLAQEQVVIQTGQPLVNYEEYLGNLSGSMKWSLTTKVPYYDTHGDIIGIAGISKDITDRKLAYEEILKLQRAVESSGEAIFITDLEGLITFINTEFTNLYGFTADEVIGKTTPRILKSGTMAPEAYKDYWAAILNKEEVRGELINKTKDGRLITIEGSANAILNDQNEIIGFIAIQHDITKRKRAELENRLLYEISHSVTTTGNLDELLKMIHHSLEKVVYAENCFIALYDKDTGLFNFPYFVDKLDPVPEPAAMSRSCTAYVFRTGKPLLVTPEVFDKLKEQKEVESVGSPSPSWIGIPLQTPSGIIGVLVLQNYERQDVYSEHDIDLLQTVGNKVALIVQRKLAEEEIKLKNELLQTINAEKDKFFSILAHDLRGPLSAFVGATQILTEEIQTMGMEEIKEITVSMKISASNIYGLLENLLEWSRLRRGTMEFVPEKLNLKEKIGACIDVLSESARKKRIELTSVISGEMEVFADNHMFDTVIRNLVSNAIKFTEEGGKINVTADYNSDHSIEIKIRDSGIGMTPELKSKLFMLSEKTSRNGTAGESSTGLGLLLCKEFIEKHGGKIWVESEEGKGSTFSFTMRQFENLKLR